MSGKNKTSSFAVEFGFDPEYLISGLTSDVTTLECILDLIDNSIDAARNEILKKGLEKDQYGLPASYAGYEITLNWNHKSLSITDNCSGIARNDFSKSAFKTGSRSNHKFGIGHFGVGMKRSIFKIGKAAVVETDDGTDNITLEFTIQDVRDYNNRKAKIIAVSKQTTGSRFVRLTINQMASDVAHEITSVHWKEALINELSTRYGRFIAKGISLKLGTTIINHKIPALKAHTCFFSL